MSIYAINHIQIAMPATEEAQARAFYGTILGFTEIPKPAVLAGRGGVWFQQGAVVVHLGVEPNFRPARKAHPAFLVDNLDELVDLSQQAGYETNTDEPPLDGYRRAHIYDPFGNRIELMERIVEHQP